MANEFIARNGLIAQKNSTVTGSLTVTAGITGSLLGTASWANNAQNINITDNPTYGGVTFYPVFVSSTGGIAGLNVDSSTFTYNPATNTLTTTASYALTAGSGGGGSSAPVITTITSTTTITDATAGTTYIYLVTGTTTLTLPTATSNTSIYTIKNTGTNTVTVQSGSVGQNIEGSSTIPVVLPVQFTSVTLFASSSNWFII